jgi:hypothetical protein
VQAVIMGGGPMLAQSRYGDLVQGGGSDAMPPSLLPAYRDRYMPWRAWAREQRISRRCGWSLLEVTLKVAFENLGIRQAADSFGVRQGVALDALQRGLWQYCLIAGWETEEAA